MSRAPATAPSQALLCPHHRHSQVAILAVAVVVVANGGGCDPLGLLDVEEVGRLRKESCIALISM